MVVSAMALVSCLRPVQTKELYGTYVAEYSFGTETLLLQDDGAYKQEVAISGVSNPSVHSGKWRYDDRAKRIILEDCLVVSDGLGGLRRDYDVPQRGNCMFPVERRYLWSGRLRLGPDEGNPYLKKP